MVLFLVDTRKPEPFYAAQVALPSLQFRMPEKRSGAFGFNMTTADCEAKMLPFHKKGCTLLVLLLTPKRFLGHSRSGENIKYAKKQTFTLVQFHFVCIRSHCTDLLKNTFCEKWGEFGIFHTCIPLHVPLLCCVNVSCAFCKHYRIIMHYSTCLFQPPFESFDMSRFDSFQISRVHS